MQNQSNRQQDCSDGTDDAVGKSSSYGDSGRHRVPLMVHRLRRRRTLHQVHRLRRRSSATSGSKSSSSEDEGAGAGPGPVARASRKRPRRRTRRLRNVPPAIESIKDNKWIWGIQLDWLECILFALTIVVAVMVLGPHIEFWAQIGTLRLAWSMYGLLICCCLSAILVMYCLVYAESD